MLTYLFARIDADGKIVTAGKKLTFNPSQHFKSSLISKYQFEMLLLMQMNVKETWESVNSIQCKKYFVLLSSLKYVTPTNFENFTYDN